MSVSHHVSHDDWRDSDQMTDHDATLSIRELLNEARAIASKRRWYGVTEGVDGILEILDQE